MTQPTATLAAATLAAAGFLTVSAPAAQAAPGDCADWIFSGAATVFVSGNFVPPDPDGFVITFAAAGKDAKGPATASSLPIIGTADGTISGGINGAMLDLTWTQSGGNGLVIPLQSGIIGPDNVAHGPVGGQFEGAFWRSTPLECTVTQGKPADAQAAPQGPPPGPTLKPEPVFGGLVVHITDNSGKTSNCHYASEVVNRDFKLNANSTFDLKIVPAVPLGRAWPVTVTCENGASTTHDIDF